MLLYTISGMLIPLFHLAGMKRGFTNGLEFEEKHKEGTA